MSKTEIPEEFRKILERITNKRARVVINHILEYGQVTTEELEKDYGYNHPPRAARDVREVGIPLKTIRVKSRDGKKTIAAYTFGDFQNVQTDRIKGRISWPKEFKEQLIKRYGQKCLISNAMLNARALQIDHRIPYEITGDQLSQELNVEDFMLLSGTINRAKSWSCENCENWTTKKQVEACNSCYWAYPENYSHVATHQIRRLDLTWQQEEVDDYEALKRLASELGESTSEYIKKVLKRSLREK